MQNKSLFESPPSLFVPNGQRLSSPSPTKDSSDAEFSSLSNPLQLPPPAHKASKSLASKARSRQEQPPKQRSLSRSQLPLTQCGVWAVCACAQLQWGRSRHSQPPNSSVQHNRSLPPAANGEQLSTWLERRRGGRRAPLLFLFPTPTTPTPISPLVPAPLRKPSPSSSSSSDSQASITHVQRRILDIFFFYRIFNLNFRGGAPITGILK